MEEMVRVTKEEDFGVLVGSAGGFAEGLEKGAVGGVMGLASVFGDYLQKIYKLMVEEGGDRERGRELNERLKKVNQVVVGGLGPAGVKYAIGVRGGVGGEVRGPLRGLVEEEKREVERVVREALEDCREFDNV